MLRTKWQRPCIKRSYIAKYLKLPVTGTLGVLIKAKKEGYVDELKPILHQMGEKGNEVDIGEPRGWWKLNVNLTLCL